MKKIYLDYLTQKKDAKKLSYDDLLQLTNMSKSKLQRIFTGQVEITLTDLEIIVEKGFGESMNELHALIGAQELKDSEKLDFKGARALLDDFNAEKALIRSEYQARIDQQTIAAEELQKGFAAALKQLEERYNANAAYLTAVVEKLETRNTSLAGRVAQEADLARAAQKRAEAAEKRADDMEKRRYQVFFCMLALVLLLVALLTLGVVLDLPLIGMGNG